VEDVVTRAAPRWDAEALRRAFQGKRVLLTGHTGFKGGWLAVWLNALGARVTGFALPADTTPSFFADAGVAEVCEHVEGDVRDPAQVDAAVRKARPDVVFHLAAQALVRRSYEEPVVTLATNVLGTTHLLDALRRAKARCAVVVVTSDKCYENADGEHAHRESDPMGGGDIYSTSKGAAELVVQGWRRSFFPPERLPEHGVALATARAGNVIGGGDWAPDRLVPDCVRALAAGRPVEVRNPDHVRPWQHVLEPLSGYLLLGARLQGADRARYGEAWNLGPTPEGARSVEEMVESVVSAWGSGTWRRAKPGAAYPEAVKLRLSIEKAESRLGWSPRWTIADAVTHTIDWYRAHAEGARGAALREITLQQIDLYATASAVR
jgi:CDP-glucose 4,6-dehydratase